MPALPVNAQDLSLKMTIRLIHARNGLDRDNSRDEPTQFLFRCEQTSDCRYFGRHLFNVQHHQRYCNEDGTLPTMTTTITVLLRVRPMNRRGL